MSNSGEWGDREEHISLGRPRIEADEDGGEVYIHHDTGTIRLSAGEAFDHAKEVHLAASKATKAAHKRLKGVDA